MKKENKGLDKIFKYSIILWVVFTITYAFISKSLVVEMSMGIFFLTSLLIYLFGGYAFDE